VAASEAAVNAAHYAMLHCARAAMSMRIAAAPSPRSLFCCHRHAGHKQLRLMLAGLAA